MTDRFSFLPYAISNVMDRAEAPNAGGKRLSLNYDLRVTVNGANSGASPVSIGADIRGPGDVIGIDHNMITRIEPTRGLRGFEPNYFPLIEFEDVDYPWRYSLDTTGALRRTPWLALIALEASEFAFVESERGPLPSIRVDSAQDSLQPPGQLWANAHVHLSDVGETDHEIDTALRQDTSQSYARLMCPRKLKPLKSYYAFLVPTYEAGRLAGLGEPPEGLDAAEFDKFAWDTSDVAVTLPVYYQWRFTTDEMEDLELLLRRLKALDQDLLESFVNPDQVSAAAPGYYQNYAKPGAVFQRETAMQIPTTKGPEFDTDTTLAEMMGETLVEVIEGETQSPDDEEDPLVAFQPYGFRYKPETDISVRQAQKNHWFDQINLDLKFRQVAGIGAEIVRKNQETFSFLAWSQYDEIVEANQKMMRLQLGAVLADRLVNRHFGRLDESASLALAAPLLGVTQIKAGTSVASALTQSGTPLSYADRTLRHVAAKRSQATKAATGGKADPVPAPSYATVSARRSKQSELRRARRSPLPARRGLVFERDIDIERLTPQNLLLQNGVASAIRDDFNVVMNMEFVAEMPRMTAPVIAVQALDQQALVQPVAHTLTRIPHAKAHLSIGGLVAEEKKAMKPVWRAPTIPTPMSTLLKACDEDALLTGVQNLPDNSVSILEENRPFVEALLVGMNHEMNNELRWREFPTDMRGTIFKRFWNRGRDLGKASVDDIAPIHEWTRKLGKNVPKDAENAAENIIVVIKGDIVRKLRDPIIAINIADGDGEFEANEGTDIEPAFVGKIRTDIAYFGFEISLEELLKPDTFERSYFVIYEAVGKLRFGLDVGTARVRYARKDMARQAFGFSVSARPVLHDRRVALKSNPASLPAQPPGPPKWDDLSWNDMALHASGYIKFGQNMAARDGLDLWSGDKTSASLARSFWQKPVAGVLPLSRVIKDG